VALDSVRRRRPPSVTLDDAPESAVAVAPSEPSGLKIPPGLLSPRQEVILAMLYDKDMDPAEVGKALGIDPQTVRSMHHKALTRLRSHFAPSDGAPGPSPPTKGAADGPGPETGPKNKTGDM
jgi:DNA-directed RNA polymerase specialized sigma24 family protein